MLNNDIFFPQLQSTVILSLFMFQKRLDKNEWLNYASVKLINLKSS